MPQVALLDDDEAFRTALADGLGAYDFRVIELGTADSLFAVLPDISPICLILDYHLADGNGLEVQATLLELGNRTPIVFLSACTEPHVASAALSAGAVNFLTKPTHLDTLVAVIHSLS